MRRREAGHCMAPSEPAVAAAVEKEVTIVTEDGGPPPNIAVSTATRPLIGHANTNSKVEDLGVQDIDGVQARGTRTTTTIPAGSIGNDRDINIVNEQWYSDDLQMLVMSKHSDPRTGETTYRLTSIDRSEPAKSLFEIPADYTVKERPEGANFYFLKEDEPPAKK